MTSRREILKALGVAALVQPLGGLAQQPQKMRRIGWLAIDAATSPRAQRNKKEVPENLLRLGYKEGANLAIEWRFAENKPERLPLLAEEMIRLKVELIVTMGDEATLAAKQATRTIPIVMAGSTLTLEKGFIESYARPGGNITGLDWWTATELADKYYEILKSAVPGAKRAVRLADSATKAHPRLGDEHERSVASRQGLALLTLVLAREDNLAKILDRVDALRPDVLYVSGSDITRPRYGEIADFARKRKLVSMAGTGYVAAGGLLQHSADAQAMFVRLASFIDRILRGAKPADLPVEQPTKYELVLNMKTAKAMGVNLSPSFMLQVDRMIE